jgi:Bacterial PH domain/Short C-terminal domain
MSYVDDLLTEGEHIVLRSRQHWVALVIRARNAFLLWLFGLLIVVAILWFRELQGDAARNILSIASSVLIVIGIVIFAYRAWQFFSQDYVVTNRRLLKVTGILTKRSADSSLEKINDAILSQTILGRAFNYGDLEILTAADQAGDKYHLLKDPITFKKTMLTQKHNLETEFAYAAPPSPPLRAEAPPPPPPAAAPVAQPEPAAAPAPVAPMPTAPVEPPPAPAMEAAAPAAAAAVTVDAVETAPASDTQDESEKVTETLARLADLRDQGAISPEEYEQKKDELLGRL